jgi:hypothetical protein
MSIQSDKIRVNSIQEYHYRLHDAPAETATTASAGEIEMIV